MPETGDTQTSTSGQRHLGRGRRPRSEAAPHAPRDVGALAREAVISFLQDASKATADREAERAVAAESEAWRLAAISVAALDRIEAAAARVEADIAVAHRTYEKLQAGAGAAAETAVHAAESAMASAGTAVEAERRVRISLRQVRQNVVITLALVAFVIIVLSVATSVSH